MDFSVFYSYYFSHFNFFKSLIGVNFLIYILVSEQKVIEREIQGIFMTRQ